MTKPFTSKTKKKIQKVLTMKNSIKSKA